MKGRKCTPDEEATIIILREAGHSIAMISEATRLSPSTIKRVCSSRKALKGSMIEELIEQARQEVISSVSTQKNVISLIAHQIRDNLAISTQIREKLIESIEQLSPSSTHDAAICMRALTAASTCVKNTTDANKALIRLTLDDDSNEELPELAIYTMTEEEIKEMRTQQLREEQELGLVPTK